MIIFSQSLVMMRSQKLILTHSCLSACWVGPGPLLIARLPRSCLLSVIYLTSDTTIVYQRLFFNESGSLGETSSTLTSPPLNKPVPLCVLNLYPMIFPALQSSSKTFFFYSQIWTGRMNCSASLGNISITNDLFLSRSFLYSRLERTSLSVISNSMQLIILRSCQMSELQSPYSIIIWVELSEQNLCWIFLTTQLTCPTSKVLFLRYYILIHGKSVLPLTSLLPAQKKQLLAWWNFS